MQKIPTMFERDETQRGHPVVDRIKPECQWVLDGEGIATAKLDGTNVKVEGGELFKRQKPKDRDYDEASYVPCRRDDPADRWAFEAFADGATDGIYELLGPKVQGNPHGYKNHYLVRVVPCDPQLTLPDGYPVPRTFDQIKSAFESGYINEGIVFHHQDGRMAKIKRRDFGLPWPIRKESDRVLARLDAPTPEG